VSLTYINGGITAVVDALSARTDVEVVSAPKLVALNNQSATLQVGDQVPIVVQQSQGTVSAGAPLVVTTEYRDTGVILKIKPRINGEHSVLVNLSQEVSAVAPTTTSGIDSPTIQQRKFESSLALPEGITVALGGLISSVRSNDNVGVPLLSRVPIAGSLFKTNTKSGRRTELIVLLTAKIIRAGQASTADVEDLKRSMGEIRERGLDPAR
jgi:general secretion pathway protein D